MIRQNTTTEAETNQQVIGYPTIEPSIFFSYPPIFPQTNIPTLAAPITIPNHDNAMSYTTRHYYGVSHHFPTLSVGIAAAPIFCGSSQIASHGPPIPLPPPSNHVGPIPVEPQGDRHKIKNDQGIMGNSEVSNTLAAPSSFVGAGHLPLPVLGSQQDVGHRLDMNPLLVPGQNNLIPGTYLVQPSLPPGCVGFNQHFHNGRLDGGVLPWPQPPVPYMHGSYVVPFGPENLNLQRHGHEAFINRDSTVFPSPFGIIPGHYSFTHHPPHLPISLSTSIYPHISPDQLTGFMSYMHHQELSSMMAPAGYPNLPPLRLMPVDDVALLEVGNFSGVQSHSDQHYDMRFDIEHMSYEELLALSDGIGTVNTGLPQEIVNEHLKTRTYRPSKTKREEASTQDQETSACIICQENYKRKEKIGVLDCGHEYHADCLKKWLTVKNVCPICKSMALSFQKKHE